MSTPNSNSSSLIVSVGVQCHVGKERTENQDRVTRAATPFGDLFVVADGVGGYQGGAEAAQATVDGFVSYLKAHGNLSLPDALQQAVRSISGDLQQRSAGNAALHGMGSTVVLAVIQGNSATYAHAGDSRVYLLRDRRLQQLTRDHSVMERMISQGILTPEQARQHPDASVLTRAIGQSTEVALDIDRIALQPHDALLLCSDGLWAYAQHNEMEAVAASEGMSASAIASALLNLALRGGGGDNISIQFLRFKAAERASGVAATGKMSKAILLPTVALASVLAISSVGMYIKNHPHWDTDPETTASASPGPQPEAGKGAVPAPVSTEKKPGKETAKPASKSADKADKAKPPAAGSPTAQPKPAGTPTTAADKPSEAGTEKNTDTVAPNEKTSITVIQSSAAKDEWSGRLSGLSYVKASSVNGSDDCLALAQASATLLHTRETADTAARVQKDLSLPASAVVEMSKENLGKCGGGDLVAMPGKLTLTQRIKGSAQKTVDKAQSQAEAATTDIKNRVDNATKKKTQDQPNTDQASPDTPQKPQSN